jgi:hypothetical protein
VRQKSVRAESVPYREPFCAIALACLVTARHFPFLGVQDGYNSLTAPITSQWRNASCALQCRLRDMRVSPAYVQDDAHHGGWVIILTAVGLVLLVLCLLIRLYVRLKYRSTLHKADGVLGIAGVYTSRAY